MTLRHPIARPALVLATVMLSVASVSVSARAGLLGPDGSSGPFYAPRVPVSALARPASWFDPSRLQISTLMSVGSSGGRGMDALQVTSLSYQFGAPLAMQVSLGNTWGPNAAKSGQSFFLEGLNVAYRPFKSLQVNVQYRDIRSPLQYGNSYGGYQNPLASNPYSRDFWGR